MKTLIALPLAVAGLVLMSPAGTAQAAPAACPPSFTLVSMADVVAELERNGVDPADVARVEEEVFGVSDRNGNDRLCQQDGSYGRAQGLPDFFSNFKDDKGR